MRIISRTMSPFPLHKLRIHGASGRVVGFSKSGDKLLMCSFTGLDLKPITEMHGEMYRSKDVEHWGLLHLGPTDSFLDVAFHPDDERMALVGNGRPIQIHRLHDGSLVQLLGPGPDGPDGVGGLPALLSRRGGYSCVVFSYLGTRIIASCRSIGNLRNEVYDLEDCELVASFSGGHSHYAFLPDWDLLAAARNDQGGASIHMFQGLDAYAGIQQAENDPPRVRALESETWEGWDPGVLRVQSMRFSPEEDMLAVSGGTVDLGVSVVKFPDLTYMHRIVYSDHNISNDLGFCVDEGAVFHPSKQRLLIPLLSGSIVEADAVTGCKIRAHHLFDCPCIALDSDCVSGLVVAGSSRGDLVLLEV